MRSAASITCSGTNGQAGADLRTRWLVGLLAEGATLQQAGSAVGVSRQRVHQILKQEGVVVRELTGRDTARARRRLERIRRRGPLIEAMWREGMSYSQIGRALGLSQRGIKQVIHERVPHEDLLKRAACAYSEAHRMPDAWALQALRDAARLLGRTPSCRSYDRLRARGLIEGPASSLVVSRLGWSSACERAGLRPNERCIRPGFGTRVYSDEELTAALKRITQALGRLPTVAEYEANRRRGEPSAVTIRSRHGGSWLNGRSELLGRQ